MNVIRYVSALVLLVFGIACSEGSPTDSTPPVDGDCAVGLTDCDGACVDLASDAGHCGQCNSACTGGECIDGECIPSECDDGLRWCDGRCVDTRSDDENCGACGEVCESQQVCESGVCVDACTGDDCPEDCETGEALCGGACVDTGRDPSHCGECDSACAEGESCKAGRCVAACEEDELLCGETCVDPKSDALHCGDCNQPCDAGMACNDGVCGCANDGEEYCEALGRCVDLTSDAENCGACGKSCLDPSRSATIATCEASECVFTCEDGFDNCDGDWENGCEVDLGSDAAHCGA